MLQSQESDENTPLTEHRVTTEEFTQAVAALEARKEEERQRLAGTVPIAETVQELGIDAKPDEIWAEVQAQRTRQAASQAKPPQSQESGPKQMPAGRYINPFHYVYQDTPRRQRRFRWFPILIAAFFFTRIFGLNIHHPSESVSPSATVSASIETFAEVPNRHIVYCDEQTLEELHLGRPLSQVLVHEQHGNNDWTLIKYDGHVYLRGYTLALSDQAMQAQPVKIYNSSPAEGLPITVRLDRLDWQGNTVGGDPNGNWSDITVSHPHLDSHAREAWSP